jgi:hypothetical protein
LIIHAIKRLDNAESIKIQHYSIGTRSFSNNKKTTAKKIHTFSTFSTPNYQNTHNKAVKTSPKLIQHVQKTLQYSKSSKTPKNSSSLNANLRNRGAEIAQNDDMPRSVKCKLRPEWTPGNRSREGQCANRRAPDKYQLVEATNSLIYELP